MHYFHIKRSLIPNDKGDTPPQTLPIPRVSLYISTPKRLQTPRSKIQDRPLVLQPELENWSKKLGFLRFKKHRF